jgi:hypothetical protein
MTSELKDRAIPATPAETGSVGTFEVETPRAEVPAAEPLGPDHVRSHSMRCYWDFAECRWRCSRD